MLKLIYLLVLKKLWFSIRIYKYVSYFKILVSFLLLPLTALKSMNLFDNFKDCFLIIERQSGKIHI